MSKKRKVKDGHYICVVCNSDDGEAKAYNKIFFYFIYVDAHDDTVNAAG